MQCSFSLSRKRISLSSRLSDKFQHYDSRIFCGTHRIVPDGGERLQLLRKTKTEAPVLAVASIQGRLLAALGRTLRFLYEMGKRQLLRKCEVRSVFPTMIKTLERLFVGDLMQGIYVFLNTKQHPTNSLFSQRI